MKKIITCSDSEFKYGHKILITSLEENPMQIYEVEIIGVSQINQTMIWNVSDSVDTKSKALDNNLDTFYSSEERTKASWILKLDATYLMKWFLISIRGGKFEVHITTGDVELNLTTLCKRFSLPGIIQHYTALECDKGMCGDTIALKKMDEDSLRLFEFIPIICPSNHFGPSCAKCPQNCRSCDSITGVCIQCQESYYGKFCHLNCPVNCLNLICDQQTGSCNGCKERFEGKSCEFEMVSLSISTGNTRVLFDETCDKSTLIDKEDTENTRSSDKSTFVSPIMEKKTTEDGNNVDQIVLWSMLVILSILVAVVIILFVQSKKKGNPIVKNVEDNDTNIELHREISTHESDLVEIVEDNPDDVEEEVITVEYNNLTSKRVSINKFLEDLPSRINNGALEGEFNDLPSGLLESYSNALKSFNRNKNRYKGIYPYDHNCVKLTRDDDDTKGYVNASYIHGYGKEKAYIAAQGPFNPRTLEDFWGVFWQNDCTRIVMLTNLYEGNKMKCLKYWPDTELNIGPYTIELDGMDVFESYTVRYLTVKYQEEVKKVTQFHFTAWPDKSVPEDVTSLISFRNLVRSGLTSSDGPIVVHCSAGIGRTGTFIAIDYLLEEGNVEQTVDVKGYVISLRHQRGKSIQTYEQYVFLHDAVVEGFTNTICQQSYLDVL
uniref:protein-tyrosine-phosphatase n=1 Tax=Magallana gigas TaxID=29159 RepID=A0A8W8M345_MAGGI